VAYGFDYLTKKPEEIRTGITFDAVLLDDASCGINCSEEGKSKQEILDEYYELVSNL
jgi:hypothetical protein